MREVEYPSALEGRARDPSQGPASSVCTAIEPAPTCLVFSAASQHGLSETGKPLSSSTVCTSSQTVNTFALDCSREVLQSSYPFHMAVDQSLVDHFCQSVTGQQLYFFMPWILVFLGRPVIKMSTTLSDRVELHYVLLLLFKSLPSTSQTSFSQQVLLQGEAFFFWVLIIRQEFQGKSEQYIVCGCKQVFPLLEI